MARAFVIVNRRARHLSKDSAVLRALLATRALGAEVHETRSLAELEEVARAAATTGVDRVVLAGGDGSYMAGVSALFRAMGDRMPAIGFAPGGTASTVARDLYGAARAADATRLVRAALGDGGERRQPTLRVRDSGGGDRVGFIFGTGLVASFFDVYYASPHQGYAGAARIVARVFAGSFFGGALAARVLEPLPARIAIDGEVQPPRAFSLVVASVIKNLGLGLRPAYRAAERFDRVHLVASPLEPRALGPQMPRVLLGRPLAGAGNIDALASRVDVEFTSPRNAYVLDGEVLRADRVAVEPGPVLRLLEA